MTDRPSDRTTAVPHHGVPAILAAIAALLVSVGLVAASDSPAVAALVGVQCAVTLSSTPARLVVPALEVPLLLTSCALALVAVPTALAHAIAAAVVLP